MEHLSTHFKAGGATYEPLRDGVRLHAQLQRVFDVMRDGQWHTLSELAAKCGGSEAAISARIRDFRKPRYGAMTVQAAYVKRGLWKYRLIQTEAQ